MPFCNKCETATFGEERKKTSAPVVVTDLDAPVKNVRLFGSEKPVKWTCENGVLTITAPDADPNLKISLCYEVEFEKK